MKATWQGAAKRIRSWFEHRGAGLIAATVLLFGVTAATVTFTSVTARAQDLAPPSLKTIPVPEPENLGEFVKSKPALIRLGKALFWDMQVGSDAVISCATCHFHAGSDSRRFNMVSPGLLAGDTTFQSIRPNQNLVPRLFPFTKFLSPDDRQSPIIEDWNDVVSSPGILNTRFRGLRPNTAVERGVSVPDDIFKLLGRGTNTRRVEPRNAPTVINAVFNFNNFWDGRADNIFNGSSPFGDADPDAGIWMPDETGNLVKQRVRIPFSSLASQAVGPPLSTTEMSYIGRTFPDIGRKLLNRSIIPLGKQTVHPRDSVLGPFARRAPQKGLSTRYIAMVRAAFHNNYWNSTQPVRPLPAPRDNEVFTQMEANFSLFFGLALQAYQATLVSDDSPYDRFMEGNLTAMSISAQEGLNIFLSTGGGGETGGKCINCHGSSTFSNASVMQIGVITPGEDTPEGIIENMIMGDGGTAWYDDGYYNIAVRPIEEDPGRGGNTPFTLPDGTPIPLSFTDRALFVQNGGELPFPTPQLPFIGGQRAATRGAFKTPTLRNVELTGPYMHTGGEATLMHVMDFYSRGGSFVESNISTFDPDITVLCGLNPNPDPLVCPPIDPAVAEANQKKVIDFMLALTDERVRWESAPFDHPELFVPNGMAGGREVLLRIPQTGRNGRPARRGPLSTFMNLHPYYPNQ